MLNSSQSGAILFIWSVVALDVFVEPAPLSAIIAAMITHSKFLSLELALLGIRVNSYCAGHIISQVTLGTPSRTRPVHSTTHCVVASRFSA